MPPRRAHGRTPPRRTPGAMRAVVKLDAATVERLASEAGDAWPVNYNSPLQTVVAGTEEACEKLDLLVKEAKGRAMKVAVSGAFQQPVHGRRRARPRRLPRRRPRPPAEPSVPVLANRTGEAIPGRRGRPYRAALQPGSQPRPVGPHPAEHGGRRRGQPLSRWAPARPSRGLVSRTLEGVTALPCETAEQLEAVLATLPKRGGVAMAEKNGALERDASVASPS